LLQPHYKDDEISAFPVYEDLSDTSEEEDIEKDSEEDEEEDEDVAGKVHSSQSSGVRDVGFQKQFLNVF
jgi:hypothetical protein